MGYYETRDTRQPVCPVCDKPFDPPEDPEKGRTEVEMKCPWCRTPVTVCFKKTVSYTTLAKE